MVFVGVDDWLLGGCPAEGIHVWCDGEGILGFLYWLAEFAEFCGHGVDAVGLLFAGVLDPSDDDG